MLLLIVRSEETDLTALLVHSPDNSKPLFGKLCWLLSCIILEHPCVQIFNHLESTCEIQETALRSSMTEYTNCDCSRSHGRSSPEYSTLLESCHSPPFRNGAQRNRMQVILGFKPTFFLPISITIHLEGCRAKLDFDPFMFNKFLPFIECSTHVEEQRAHVWP